ncbi:MAG: hypothetical protein MI919_04645 [Holophagales bacterium]|nr:hypothetical protein [Holophagales bacterium]
MFRWMPTASPPSFPDLRYEDVFFVDEAIGWAVTAFGPILKTENGGASWSRQLNRRSLPQGNMIFFRSCAFRDARTGWVGSLTEAARLLVTRDGGAAWQLVDLPGPVPHGVCGLSVAGDSTVVAAGTNDPRQEPGIFLSQDDSATWTARSLADQASNLIDVHFQTPERGWVTGGIEGSQATACTDTPNGYENLVPVVLFTDDGGQSFTNLVEDLEFPPGEWGWKIFFLDESRAYIALENACAAAILISEDGGTSWRRQEVEGNADIQAVGFVDAATGWVGGWGAGDPEGNPTCLPGTTSATSDGGASWREDPCVGRFLNRFRFVGPERRIGYAAGDRIYKYAPATVASLALVSRQDDPQAAAVLAFDVPEGARHLEIVLWSVNGRRVRRLVAEDPPEPGPRQVVWDGLDDSGEPAGPGIYAARLDLDGTLDSVAIRLS